MWGKEVVLILFGVLGLDVVLGCALCFGFRVVLWIIVFVLGGALCIAGFVGVLCFCFLCMLLLLSLLLSLFCFCCCLCCFSCCCLYVCCAMCCVVCWGAFVFVFCSCFAVFLVFALLYAV